ncbi:MAG: thioredoxin [Nitrososphaerota archaeon]
MSNFKEDEGLELEMLKMKKLMKLLQSSKKHDLNYGKDSFPSKPLLATDDNFDTLIAKYPIVVVDFWAEWCLPCRVIAPVIEELAEKYSVKIVFIKLNVDENPITASRYNITSIPTLMIFKNGKPIDVIVGAYPKKIIEERIKRHIEK